MSQAWAAEDIRAAEEPFIAAGVDLMGRAAMGLAVAVCAELRRRGGVAGRHVVALVGSGNNGADALVAARRLMRRGVSVTAVVVHRPPAAQWDAFRRAGGRGIFLPEDGVLHLAEKVWCADLILDALTGIGGSGGLRGGAARLVSALLATQPLGRRASVIAVDLPSGIGVDDGTLPGPVLPADHTVTFGALKPGLILAPSARVCGEVGVVDLGLALPGLPQVQAVSREDILRYWPPPRAADHKYTRGVVGVVAGSRSYPGAGVLTSSAAVHSGAGLVRYRGGVPELVLATRPEVVTQPGRVNAWVLGPGLDPQRDRQLCQPAFEQMGHVPMVVDAGALDAIRGPLPPTVVLTPHAGELAALLNRFGENITRDEVAAAPLRWARQLSDHTGATVLLKGDRSVVVHAQSAPVWCQIVSTPALATAGSGDVLAGVLGTVLALAAVHDQARTVEQITRLVACAVWVHAHAGITAARRGPVAAQDVAAAIPAALQDGWSGA